MSIYSVRAFVKMREAIGAHRELTRKMGDLERKYAVHDTKIKAIFDAIRALMAPPKAPRRRIGF